MSTGMTQCAECGSTESDDGWLCPECAEREDEKVARLQAESDQLQEQVLVIREALEEMRSARETGRCGISAHCRLDQENTRLRTALEQIAARQPTEPADSIPDNGNMDDAYDRGVARGDWLCGEIARAALQAGSASERTS